LFTTVLFYHTLTTLFIMSLVLLLTLYGAFQRIATLKELFMYHNNATLLALVSALALSWWMYSSGFLWSTMVGNLVRLASGGPFSKSPIPPRFFDISLPTQIRILILLHAGDALLLSLSVLGLFFKIRHLLHDRAFVCMLILLFVAPLTMVAFEMILRYGDAEYTRFIGYSLAISPPLVASLISANGGRSLRNPVRPNSSYSNHRKLFVLVSALLIFTVVSLQSYPNQGLVPNAREISEELSDEPLIYLTQANSDYQIRLLHFAQSFLPGDSVIIADSVTRVQAIGFCSSEFAGSISYRSGLAPDVGGWEILLLHHPGGSGIFYEPAEWRSSTVILGLEQQNSKIYTNGESFVLARTTGAP